MNTHGPLLNTSGTFNLVAGQKYSIKAEFFQGNRRRRPRSCFMLSPTERFRSSPQSQLYSNLTAPPSTAPVLAAIGSNGAVTLNWTSASGAAVYSIKRALTANGPFTPARRQCRRPDLPRPGPDQRHDVLLSRDRFQRLWHQPRFQHSKRCPYQFRAARRLLAVRGRYCGRSPSRAALSDSDRKRQWKHAASLCRWNGPYARADVPGNTSVPAAANNLGLDFAEAPGAGSEPAISTMVREAAI